MMIILYVCLVLKMLYWMNLFSDVKRDIDRGYPVLLLANDHVYVILGYAEGGTNGNCIYTCTGWSDPTFEVYKFTGGTMCSINIY